MSETITRSSRQLLVREISRWESEALISSQLCCQLLSLYPESAGQNGRPIAILMTIGGMLVGLGGLLFVGSNWAVMPNLFKLGLIFLAIVSANVAGWICKFEPGGRPKLGSALLLIGALFYGAGIWLISQMFHLDLNLANGLFFWAAGTIPIALLTESSLLGVLAIVLIAAWNLAGCGNTVNVFAENVSVTGMIYFAVSLICQLYVSRRLRSNWCLSITLIFGAIFSVSCGESFGLLAYGIAAFAGYLWQRQSHPRLAGPFMVVGMLAGLGALFTLTFSVSQAVGQSRQDGLVLWLASWISLALVAATRRRYASEIAGCALCLLSGLLVLIDFAVFRAMISNVVLCGALVGLVYTGINRLKSITLVNIALTFCVIDICGRYFDLFFKTLDRSIFFVVGGIALLALGTYLEQNRRKLVEGIR